MSNIIDLTFLGDLLDISGNDITITPSGNFNVVAPLDVTGSVTADGIASVVTTDTQGKFSGWSLVGANSSSGAIELGPNSAFQGVISYAADANTRFIFDNTYGSTASTFEFRTNTAATAKTHLKILGSGDINLGYETTGVTPKLFWDASDESLIIGSGVNTYAKLTVATEGTSVGSTIRLVGTNTIAGASQVSHITSYQPTGGAAGDAALDFKVRGGVDPFATPSTVMTLLGGGSGGGSVGIGTDSPDTLAHLAAGAGLAVLRLENTDAGLSDTEVVGKIEFETQDTGGAGVNSYIQAVGQGTGGANKLQFGTGTANSPATRMTIDADGNVGIGGSPDTRLTVFGGGVAEFRVGNIGPSNNSAIRVSRNDTSVTSGNPLGYLEFGGNDSTSNVDSTFAYVGAEVSGAHTAGDNPTDLIFGVTADNTAAPTEAMRIDSQGRVGIKTPNPTSLLHIFDGQGGTEAQTDLLTLQTQRSDFGSGGSSILFFDTESPPSTSGGNASSRGRIKAYTDNTDEFQTDFRFSLSDRSDSVITSISADTTTITVVHVASVGLGVEVGDYVTIQSTTNFNGDFVVTGVDSGTQFTIAATGYDAFAEETSGNIAKSETFDRMVITGTGNVGIGTNSPSYSLQVQETSPIVALQSTGVNASRLLLSAENDAVYIGTTYGVSNIPMIFSRGGTSSGSESMRIDANGNVGISTDDPVETLSVGATPSVAGFSLGYAVSQVFLRYNNYFSGTAQVSDVTKGSASISLGRSSDGVITFNTAAAGAGAPSEAMRIDANGNVGIGVVANTGWNSTYKAIQVGNAGAVWSEDASSSNTLISNNEVYDTNGNYYRLVDGPANDILLQNDGSFLFRSTATSEVAGAQILDQTTKMTIDASGNLLVGKSSLEYENTAGHIFRADGLQSSIRSAGNAADFNRIGSGGTEQGEIIRVSSNGTTVGSIGAANGNLYLGQDDTTIMFSASADAILPKGTDGADRDGFVNLGQNINRFKDLHLSGGVVFGDAGGSGTSSSNTFDSYEEGTWTPVYDAVSGAATYATQTGSYTKIGNKVMVAGVLQAQRGTLSGTTVIAGLPFAVNGNGGGVHINFALNFATDMPNLKGYTSGNQINFRTQATNASTSIPLAPTDLSDVATTHNYMYFTAHYFTT